MGIGGRKGCRRASSAAVQPATSLLASWVKCDIDIQYSVDKSHFDFCFAAGGRRNRINMLYDPPKPKSQVIRQFEKHNPTKPHWKET